MTRFAQGCARPGIRPADLSLSFAFTAQQISQGREQRQLARQHRFARLLERHPPRRIDFDNGLDRATPRRPLKLETVAVDRAGMDILLERERFDDLAARLARSPVSESPLSCRAREWRG